MYHVSALYMDGSVLGWDCATLAEAEAQADWVWEHSPCECVYIDYPTKG